MARILLVEDDDSVRGFVSRALEIDSHSVVIAENGAVGHELFQADEEAFDLVLSDIQMPEMDGIEMASRIANINENQKILLMTGYADQRERADGISKIVVDVVQKPFSLPEIRQRVAKALAA